MELQEIEQHWKNWAQQFKLDVRATTKTRTIKELEVAALYRAFKKTPFFDSNDTQVLEVGCGNGHNCFMLSDLLPNFTFTGVDFIPEMVESANQIKASDEKYGDMTFLTGNVLALDECQQLEDKYDIVFTDRCIINLNSHELQAKALKELSRKTADGGFIVLIENIQQSYDQQNGLRESLGLEARTPDKFNLFLDEPKFLEAAQEHLTLVSSENFASLHDLLLYVLVPSFSDGKVDYDSPVVKAATKLLLAAGDDVANQFGGFGQNRLYLFKKEA